jgi:uncharacterized membrane protein HdeD (DUF308 family)
MGVAVALVVEVARWWWVFILRGLVAIAFGVLAFLSPGWGIAILVTLFAVWALFDGVTGAMSAIMSRDRDRSWWVGLLEGIVGIAAGIIAIVFPELAAEVLVLLIAAWSIVTGLFEIWSAIRLREQITGEQWLALAGLASVAFGVLLFFFPAAGALTIVWLIGGFAIVWGVVLILLGWRLRGINELAKRDAAHDFSR